MPTCGNGTCSTAPTCPPAPPRCWPPGTRWRWPASAPGTWPPSTSTAASPSRCSTSATAWACAPDDPRGLTVTGGLPFFGGAGNNYSMHAIAETVQRARANPGSYGFVGANGGIMSKYSVGVYSTTPAAWRPDRQRRAAGRDRRLGRARAGAARRRLGDHRDLHDQARPRRRPHRHRRRPPRKRRAPLRRPQRRPGHRHRRPARPRASPSASASTCARSASATGSPSSEARMDELFPPEPAVLRDRYEHVLVRRDGHLLEVTINRPEARNSLHPAGQRRARPRLRRLLRRRRPVGGDPHRCRATRPSRPATTWSTPPPASPCGSRRTGSPA